MNKALYVIGGIGAGFLLASLLANPSSCCKRVASGVRDRVQSELGGTAVAIGDALGIWQFTPGLLDVFGVS